MSLNEKTRKKWIAAFFAVLLLVQDFYPATVYALTSGPAQPEMQKFQPAGASDMVDLFSGDFKYDIPLMDVDGYPLNLSYHSGAGIEDEASWVGSGWSLNPGSITRNMRGLPDDFTGDNSDEDPQDVVKTVQVQKPYKKIGAQLLVKPTLMGFDIGKASLHLDVHKDNYWGIGASIGGGVNFNLDLGSASTLTAGLNLNSDNRDGVTVNPNLSITQSYDDYKENNNASLSGGFSYNTRSGLESVDLGLSFNPVAHNYDEYGNETGKFSGELGFASFDKYYSHTYTPTHSNNTVHKQATFSLDLGATIFGGYFGLGGSGYVYTQQNIDPTQILPAYGYMHYSAGLNNPNALLDFNREKDGVFNKYQPAIPVPVSTPDYFVATSQGGMQQFRPIFNGNYIVYDRQYTDKTSSTKFGLSIGGGNLFQGGAQLNVTSGQSVTQKWDNSSQDFFQKSLSPATGPDVLYEKVYFKQSGEQTRMPDDFYSSVGQLETKKVAITTNSAGGPTATANLASATSAGLQAVHPMIRSKRDIRTATFDYLTAQQATTYGLDKLINGTPRITDMTGMATADKPFLCIRKPHHISEVKITDKEGKRMIYGIPVYNRTQEEVSFSVASPSSTADGTTDLVTNRRLNLIDYDNNVSHPANGDNTPGNAKGRFNNFNQKTVSPYATSFLLTGILSPDYVDKTGDGISDDDLGTAIKFSYVQRDGVYNWRAPFESGKANYNEGFLSDHQDDKGSYAYGTKEVWYMNKIQTKSMVAIFYTSDRKDGLGASDENNLNGPNTNFRLQKLDKIALFSRTELDRNGANAVPIKVVHFEYDYSSCPGVPNNSGETDDPTNLLKGKLTLKKVYFTFGASTRGQTNPYVFNYDNNNNIGGSGSWGASIYDGESTDQYLAHQVDRWGTYRQSYFTTPAHTYFNGEYPYSLQPMYSDPYDVRKLADRFASKWQLTNIVTPTGASISVTYESDDYSYVQDRKAMEMCPVVGFSRDGLHTGMISHPMIYVRIPAMVPDKQTFFSTYLSGPNGKAWTNVFFRVMTNLNNKSANEYVYGYAEIDQDYTHYDVVGGSDVVGIPLININGHNPISVAAWQLLQADLPQFAYPNYDNSNIDNLSGDVTAAVESIIQGFANLRELFESFDDMASAKHFGDVIDPSHSVVRLNFPVGMRVTSGADNGTTTTKTYGKLGGGSRVNKVEISDNWAAMNPASDAKTMNYGVEYDYTAKDDQGNSISSGVASYEPEIGNEENPFREPVSYTDKVQWSNDRYSYIEKPFGESYFPAASVGYRQVTATAYGIETGEANPHKNTGRVVSQYYTARDFPTQADYMPLDEETYEYDMTLLLFGAKYTNQVATSQGFRITLNDMHGKPKSVQVYDMNSQLINETDYLYNVADNNAQQKQLNNTVLAMDKDGTIPSAGLTIGTDIEVVSDVRESKITSTGNAADVNAGAFLAFIAPIGFAGGSYSSTKSLNTYNSVAFVKVIHQYGILKEVRTTQNGSTLTADNLLWDAMTGEVLLTRNQTEFDDYTYALHYPAFRAYDGMSGAYENTGTVLAGFHTDVNAQPGSEFMQYLSAGDELVNLAQEKRGWLLQDPKTNNFLFVDQGGNAIYDEVGNYMIIRSGRRNLLSAGAGSVVTMTNPLVLDQNGYDLKPTVDRRVLDSKAVTYKDEWGVPVPDIIPPDQDQIYSDELDDHSSISSLATNNDISVSFPIQSQCPGTQAVFGADVFQLGASYNHSRSYLDLGPGPGYNINNLPITKVILTLTPAGAFSGTGNNAVYIRRVTSPMNGCVFWGAQPSNTTNNQISIPAGPAPSQPIQLDLTTMYMDWVNQGTNKDNPDFAIVILLQDESTNVVRSVSFDGINSVSGIHPMVDYHYSIPSTCTDPINHIINPYYKGIKGNWRPAFAYAYQVYRDGTPGNPGQTGGTNIRSNGYYTSYDPFWSSLTPGPPQTGVITSEATLQPLPVTDPINKPGIIADKPRWIWSTRSIYFDQKGNEIENVDALNRYGSVLFGYQQTLATAVASNARHNEIVFDGFEDYNLPSRPNTDPCPIPDRQLNLGFTMSTDGQSCPSGTNCVVSSQAHSGNYSLNFNSGTLSVFTPGGSDKPTEQIIDFDNTHAFLKANEQVHGFNPIPNKPYVLSMWVKDGLPLQQAISGLEVSLTGSSPQDLVNPVSNAVVEGWKQLTVNIKPGTTGVQLKSSGNLYVDDLRIFPFDAELKSFVYDDRSLRVMAQLDENNFAVFYEYDREGTPIRVKKETEKGVMTVKESRQSLRTH